MKRNQLRDRIRQGEPIPWPTALLLNMVTPIVRLGMWRRLHQSRIRVPAYVISYGNLSAGGTGKTPAVIARAKLECAAGKKVAVLIRGYRAINSKKRVVVSGKNYGQRVEEIGDEAALILRKVPDILLIKSADRVAAARVAVQEHHCDTLILDDGFQYVRLERDENIVVIDATNPFGNGCLIPRGILREPLKAIHRATSILLTHCDQTDPAPTIEFLRKLAPETPITKSRHAPTGLRRISDGADISFDDVRAKDVTALCAIGNPESFFSTLNQLGIPISQRIAFPDHSVIPPEAIPNTGCVITTEKDAVKIQSKQDNLLALTIELQFMP